jgi:hypothetical protein
MAMTGSRTAWLTIAMLVPTVVWARDRLALRTSRTAALCLGAVFVAWVVAWPAVNELLLLAPGRTLADQARAGPRPLFYSTMADAISRQPWFGYGWEQGLVAQITVIDDHPAGGRLMGNSHNLVLDLLVWNGVPLGLLITGLLAWWGVRHARACRDATSLFLLTAIGGVTVHAMLEYPLSYAYFLLPIGLMVGALDAISPGRCWFGLPRAATVLAAGAATALIALVTADYLKIETNTEVLRMEVARIGTHRITSQAPDLVLLTQWHEYLRFARVAAHPGMTDAELLSMGDVVERFPYASALREYAVANALNGQPALAGTILTRLCKLHTANRCRRELQAWIEQTQATYPQLAAVPIPAVPALVPTRHLVPMAAL